MKKLFCTFLMLFISAFAHANIHIDGDVAKQVILSHIDTTYQAAALEEYNNQLESSGDYTMSASGLYKVCIASGWDIKTPDGKTKCDSFVKALIDGGSYTYYAVCGPDKGKSGGTERCIDNVFYHWYTVADTQVTMLQADGLCKEYARIKFNDDIECSNKSRPGTVNPNNDYIKCTSKLTPTYYEFKFDDVVESKDINITASVGKAVCEMHGVDYIYSQCSQHSTFSSEVKCYPAKCKTSDANLCTKINESMKRFGYNTKIQNKECVISENTIISESQLRTAFGINNMAFKTGYQVSAYSNMRSQLCEYISKNANTTITSCECNYNRTQLIRDGKTDDILTCYANGKPIDFVFDDLSEHNKKIAQGNMEAFACSVLGGEYQGETCFTPDKKLCNQIASATIAECPECSKAYFDTEKNACVLPNATKANQHQKKVNIGLIVGGAVVGAGIIIYTGGTGFAAVAVTIETIAAGMELGGQIHIDGVADEFFIKANNCNNATCAEDVLQEYFQYISRMTNDLQSGEKLGIDSKMATLVEMLPNDSQFLIDTVAGCYEDNGDNFDIAQCDDGVWNPDQIIRAIGIGLQFTSVFTSVGKWMLGAGRVQKIVNQTPNLTKALQKKIPGVKDAIQKSAKQGKILKTSNGKTVKALGQVDTEYMGKLKGWQVTHIDVVKDVEIIQVYKFTENLSGKTYYLKHTDELEEITRTKRAYDILGNRSDIVHTVKVIEDDQQVLIDFATKNNLPSHRGNYWFITEEMPSSRTAYNLLEDSSDLGGKPITLAEQEEIINAVKRLNDGGIYHGDLGSNMFFLRDSSGKLRVDIIDYEPWSVRDIPNQDLEDVNEMFEVLADVGLAEIRVGENGVVAVKGEDGVIKILTQGSEDLMSSRYVSHPSMLDNSDEAGKLRIQALKEKYGIKLEDNTVYIPDGIADIMRNELGNSNVEKEFYEEVRRFIYESNDVFGNPVDIGDFRLVDKVAPSSSALKDKVAPFRERFASNPKTVNTATGDNATSQIREKFASNPKTVNTATGNNATSQIGFGFNRGGNNTVTRLEPKVVTQTPEVTPKRSWAEIQAAAEEEGRIRIQKFKEKYNLSIENRRKYTKEQWEEILSEELGYSDIEDNFRRDFRKDMNNFYWNR